MPMIITQDSAWGKELARWNTPRNQFVRTSDDQIALDYQGTPIRGMGAIGYEPYPKMMYRAQQLPNGKPSVGETMPHPMYVSPQEYEQQCLFLEGFNRNCRREVKSEEEERYMFNQGWRPGQQEALDLYEREQRELARAAAEAAHTAARMSAKAQREFAVAEDATHVHVADVPAPPQPPRRTTPMPPPAPHPIDPPVVEPPAPVAEPTMPSAAITVSPRELIVQGGPEPPPPPARKRGRPRQKPTAA